jgi:hypothetical protein
MSQPIRLIYHPPGPYNSKANYKGRGHPIVELGQSYQPDVRSRCADSRSRRIRVLPDQSARLSRSIEKIILRIESSLRPGACMQRKMN